MVLVAGTSWAVVGIARQEGVHNPLAAGHFAAGHIAAAAGLHSILRSRREHLLLDRRRSALAVAVGDSLEADRRVLPNHGRQCRSLGAQRRRGVAYVFLRHADAAVL